MTERPEHVLSAALRAHADLASGSARTPPRNPRTRSVPAWVVLATAVVLGTLAGALAGLISLL